MIWPLFILGVLLMIFSHPKILRPIMSRLFNEGLVTPRALKPEKAEVIRFAGPNLSLFAIGFVLIIISFTAK